MKPLPRDLAFAEMIAWLKEHGMEAHTDIRGRTVFRKKVERGGK